MVESFKNAEVFSNAITEKIRKDMSYLPYEPAAVFTASYIIYCVQSAFSPDDKEISLDYDAFFELSGIKDKSQKKFFRDSLGDGIGKLSDMFFVYPNQAVLDFLLARGARSPRLTR